MKRLVCLAAILSLAGCIDVKERPLAANVVRVETNAQGAFFTGSAADLTMRRAAEATLRKGYSHFILADESVERGSVASSSRITNPDGTTSPSRTRIPTSTAGATVVMFRASDPGAREAYDAKAVLKQLDAKSRVGPRSPQRHGRPAPTMTARARAASRDPRLRPIAR